MFELTFNTLWFYWILFGIMVLIVRFFINNFFLTPIALASILTGGLALVLKIGLGLQIFIWILLVILSIWVKLYIDDHRGVAV